MVTTTVDVVAVTRRVLYCSDTFPPQLNGVSVVTALAVNGLRERGWEVKVIAPRYPDHLHNVFTSGAESIGENGVTTVPSIPFPGYPDLRLAAPSGSVIAGLIDEFKPDLVHLATEFMLGRLGQRAATARGVPCTSSYHTDFSRYTESYGLPSLKGPVQRYLGRFHRRSRRVYTPGSPAAAELRALDVSEVEVWGRGVDLGVFDPAHRDIMLRSAYAGPDTVLFLHVGRLAPEKGVERIIEGFTRARLMLGSRQPMHLLIAGTGPREKTLRALADNHVSFLGALDRATMLPRLYASADGFLFASETETLGLVILEAMASGLPVIATPAGGVADHLRDGSNGLAFPPGDTEAMAAAIVRIAASPVLRRTLSSGARRTALAMGWDRELDRLDESYRELLATT